MCGFIGEGDSWPMVSRSFYAQICDHQNHEREEKISKDLFFGFIHFIMC